MVKIGKVASYEGYLASANCEKEPRVISCFYVHVVGAHRRIDKEAKDGEYLHTGIALRSVVIGNLINVQQTGNTDKQIHRGISQSCGVD